MDSRVKNLLDLAAERAGEDASLARFLLETIKAADPDDLLRFDSDFLLKAFARAHDLLISGRTDVTSIHATQSREASDPLIINIICPDMPFIVDSALAALRAMGGAVRLFAHPVVRVEGGKVTGDVGSAVSVLHIHSDPVADNVPLLVELTRTLDHVRMAVQDWQPMLDRSLRAMAGLKVSPSASHDEAQRFIEWLTEHNFTFLGMREYSLSGEELVPVPGTGLGIMRNDDVKVVRSGPDYVESTPQLVDFVKGPEPILVTKANLRSIVHRRVHMDYVGIKLFNAEGVATGELRLVGLFTAQALATPHTEVPLIRRKIAEVMRLSGVDPLGHAGRTLLGALDAHPRDELFQIEVDQLSEFAEAIAALYDRPRVRVLPRIDRFDNFVSVLVYVPRERYDGTNRARITRYLADVYDGRISAYYPHFPEGELVRLHVIIGRTSGATPRPSRQDLEASVDALLRDFWDRLVAAAPDPGAISDFRQAFSPAYQSRNSVEDALADIEVFRATADGDVSVRLTQRAGDDGALGLKFYHRGAAIPLSDRVPMLEHFGFRVIDERTYTLTPRDGVPLYLHDMVLEPASGQPIDVSAHGADIEEGILAVWHGLAESDQLNTLVSATELGWRDAALLRALSRYLRQVGTSYSQRYIAQVMVTQSASARALCRLFAALHDPALANRDSAIEAARAAIAAELEAITSLDEDTIIRRFQNLIEASLRTNAWQRGEGGAHRPALAIKFDSHAIEALAEPRPYREIYVYSPRVEGIHLRFGAIARGGLRWSDRPEDFRTEVLGLVKAQQVKNAVIVPVGAKGGFVPKRLTAGMPRDAWLAEGTESYRIFIGSMLDITDNLIEGAVVPPPDTVRRDSDDPYLVVAADKGTAQFSDTANAIAIERNFWLGDAFASGGSAGYDHKKMAITARGAWEAVKRHFRELNHDTQTQPFTVAGVGDMSGDVFGNGMLLSRQIKLVAAFDHRDIFLDPKPDPDISFAERERLFRLPRSSWQDYNPSLISKGGGVFPRSAKSIPLSKPIQTLLGIDRASATPAEVMRAILCAPVDLLWFGGIGTYIKASGEDDAAVGDRANDAIRVSADAVRARVVGEGANLGVTQRGRIQYALGGGRINTDAIDNSAGVNSSDLEVNIKIALAPVVASGALSAEDRKAFLASMTDEVAQLCLRNNYLQTLALSLAEGAGLAALPSQRLLMDGLEAAGHLDRAIEFLPSDVALDQRASAGNGLTRPELAVLLAYAKLTLYDDLLAGEWIDDAYLSSELPRYFPPTLTQTYPEAVESHRLRREVIATVLANAMINRGGPTFVSELMTATSTSAGEVALAYVAVRDIYGLSALNADIDGLDGVVPGSVQLALYAEVAALLRRETLWYLRNADVTANVAQLVERHRAGVERLRTASGLLPLSERSALDARARALTSHGVPDDLALSISELPLIGHASDIALVAERSGVEIETAATAYFAAAELFDLFRIIEAGRAIVLEDRFDRMALDRSLANIMRALRDLTADILTDGSIEAFRSQRSVAVERTVAAVHDLTKGTITLSRLNVAAGLLADLAREF